MQLIFRVRYNKLSLQFVIKNNKRSFIMYLVLCIKNTVNITGYTFYILLQYITEDIPHNDNDKQK